MVMGCETLMLPEPVSASRLKCALPTIRRTEPLPVLTFQSLVGWPAASMSPEPVLALSAPETPCNRMLPLPVSALTSPGPG